MTLRSELRKTRLVEAAAHVAVVAHAEKEQQRKNSSAAKYVTHPVSVALLLSAAGVTCPVTIAAALLHDVLEDTSFTADGVATVMTERFGCSHADVAEILAIVASLSEVKRGPDGAKLPWRVRKLEHIERMKRAPSEAVIVKIADSCHNVLTLLDEIDRTSAAEALAPFNAAPEELEWYWEEVASLGDSDSSKKIAAMLRAAVAAVSSARCA